MNRPRENSEQSVDDPHADDQRAHEQRDSAHIEHETPLSTTSIDHQSDEQTRELDQLHELSSLVIHLHAQLRSIHASLGERYQPSLESQSHRLTLERDETLIAWGQALLGLCSAGMSLELINAQGYRTPILEMLNAQPALPLQTSDYTPVDHPPYSEIDHDGDARVFGAPPHRLNASLIKPSTGESRDHQEALSSKEPTQRITQADESLNQAQSSNGSEIIDPSSTSSGAIKSETEDPGVADAPQVSLAQFSLDDLRKQMLNPKGWSQGMVDAEEEDEDTSLHFAIEVVQRIGTPRSLNAQQLREHLIELEAEVDCCQRWSIFNQEVQHAVVTLITSRLRNIQDQIGDSTFDQERIAKMFRRLTRFSSDFRPGFVHGLSRDKIPEYESWKVDETHAWRRLEQLLNIQPELPKLSPERTEKLERLKNLLTREEEIPNFSNELRAAVTECINSGFPQDSPHLSRLLEHHLSHLSGKRFKKLRLAASTRV